MNRYARISLCILACVYFWYYAATYTDWHFIDSVDLIFHEAGHIIFIFFGEFIHILMGSGLQVLLPLGIAAYFFLHRQNISGSLCLLWTGANLLNVSIYAGDALAMRLPLLGGDSVIHDWNYLLGTTGMLKYAETVASAIHGLGLFAIVCGTALAIYFACSMSGGDGGIRTHEGVSPLTP